MKTNRKRTSRLPKKTRIKLLSEHTVFANPLDQFNSWFQQVLESKTPQPFAMVLATASANGRPTARTVLLKGVDQQGFSFYTNYESMKGKQLSENPHAALLFYWPQFERQVRIEGTVEKLSREESREYFSTRPRNSRISTWASRQSETIESRSSLEDTFERFKQQFRNNEVPLPDYWGGYRLRPSTFEFWQSRPNRLHDRITFVKEGVSWRIVRLSP